MTTIIATAGAAVLCHSIFARNLITMAPIPFDGLLRATQAPDGALHLGAAVQVLHPGEAFGWARSFCVAPDTGIVLVAQIRRSVNQQILASQMRDILPDAQGCGSAAWEMRLPSSTIPGRYELHRIILLTPAHGEPSARTLPKLNFEALP